jgi:hypothetical protein
MEAALSTRRSRRNDPHKLKVKLAAAASSTIYKHKLATQYGSKSQQQKLAADVGSKSYVHNSTS